MTYPFYYLDGSLKGETIDGDFRPNISSKMETYQKATYAGRVITNGHWYRIYCDVAYSTQLPEQLPEEAYENIQIESSEGAPPLERRDRLWEKLKIVPGGGGIPLLYHSPLSDKEHNVVCKYGYNLIANYPILSELAKLNDMTEHEWEILRGKLIK